MTDDLYFHDGNFVSISISGFDNVSICEVTLGLYKNADVQNRTKCVITINNCSRISLIGDFFEINKNHFAGAIEDGSIHPYADEQRLILRITGGYLEVFGQIKVDWLSE
ncbi:hypothetical protein JCM14076_11940 [Methylosoma difficile]